MIKKRKKGKKDHVRGKSKGKSTTGNIVGEIL